MGKVKKIVNEFERLWDGGLFYDEGKIYKTHYGRFPNVCTFLRNATLREKFYFKIVEPVKLWMMGQHNKHYGKRKKDSD